MCAGASPGLAVRRCSFPALPHGGAVELPRPSTKRLLSVSPRAAARVLRDRMTPFPGLEPQPGVTLSGTHEVVAQLSSAASALSQPPSGASWSQEPQGSVSSQNPRKPLFSTQHTKCSAMASPSWTVGLPAIQLEF